MTDFKPTYLYIKQHSKTGKLYFGKTTKTDVDEYLGSGKHWIRHINAHGKSYVITLWKELFNDRDEIIEFATKFSEEMNIVESESWLNLKAENGLDGGAYGEVSIETRRKLSEAGKGKIYSVEVRKKMSSWQIGRKMSPDAVEKIKLSKIGKKPSEETRKKMSESQKNRTVSEEGKKNMSEAQKKRTDGFNTGKTLSTKGGTWSEARRLAQQNRKKVNP